MAKKVVLDFEISGVKQQVKTFMELKEAISDSKKQLESVEFGSADFEKQKAQIQELEKAYRSLGKTAEDTAQEEIDAADKAAKAQGDSTKEKRESIMGAADDFEKFAKGIVDAVSGIAIAMGASDEDTKAMMESFMKFQGIATAVKGGIESVIVVVKNWAAIQRVLNLVLVANPIGLIIVGVAALAAGIYLLIKNIDSVIEVFSDWKNIVLALMGPLGWILIYLNEADKAEKELESTREKASAQATAQSKKRISELKSEHAEFKKAKEAENDTLEKRIQIQENIGESSYALRLQLAENNAAILKDELETTKGILLAKQEEFRIKAELAGMTKDAYAQSIGLDYESLVGQANTILDGMVLDVEVAESSVTKIKKDENQKRSDSAQSQADEENAIREKALQDELARLHRLQAERNQLILDIETAENAYYDSKLTQQERDEQAVNDYYYNLKTKAEEEKINTEVLEEAHQAKIAEIRKKYADEDDAKKKAQNEKNKADYEAYVDEIVKKEQEAKEKKEHIQKQYRDSVLNITETIFTLTNRFGKQDEEAREKRAKRQFQINKALALSAAVIDGFKAITASLAAAPLVIGVVPNPVGIANLVATAAMTAANIAKIASSQYKSSGSGGGSAPSIASSGGAAGSAPTGSSGSPQFNPQTLYAAGANTNNITPFKSGANEVGPAQPVVIQNNISLSEINSGNATLTNLMAATTI